MHCSILHKPIPGPYPFIQFRRHFFVGWKNEHLMESFEKRTRNMLGLGQQEMADYLGTTRVFVSLAEIGKRQLPGEAYLKMGELSILLSSPAPLLVQARSEQYAEDAEIEKRQLLEKQYPAWERELMQLEKTREKFIAEKSALIQKLARLSILLDQPHHSPSVTNVLETAYQALLQKMQDYAPAHELHLERKCFTLQQWLDWVRSNR